MSKTSRDALRHSEPVSQPAAHPVSRRDEFRAMARLALPVILGHWTQMAMHALDTAMVGRLGVEAVAASSLGNIATAPFFLVVSAVGSALPPLAAKALAAGDAQRAERLLRHAWACSAALPLLATAAFPIALQLMSLSGQPDSVVAQARPYAWLLMVSMLPMMLLQNLRGYVEARGHPWLPLGNIAIGLTVNAGCNIVLIHGAGPIPAFGVPGAAIGTAVARLVMLAHFLWLLRRRRDAGPSPGWFSRGSWSAEIFAAYLKLGIGTAVVTALVIGSGVVISFWAARLGPDALAEHEIARQVWVLGYVVPFGWSMAVAIRIGHWLGSGNLPNLRTSTHLALLGGLGIGASLAALVIFGRHLWPTVFLGGSAPELARRASLLLPLVAVVFFVEGPFLAGVGVCRGLGKMVAPALAYLVSYWVVGLAAAAILGHVGVFGLWLGIVTGIAPGAVALAWVAARYTNQRVVS